MRRNELLAALVERDGLCDLELRLGALGEALAIARLDRIDALLALARAFSGKLAPSGSIALAEQERMRPDNRLRRF
jgi:hypothetical protein